MEKWGTLKSWLELHESLQSDISGKMVLEYMDTLEDEEKSFARQLAREGILIKEMKGNNDVFLHTGVPSFDQNTWIQILAEKGLQGLS